MIFFDCLLKGWKCFFVENRFEVHVHDGLFDFVNYILNFCAI